MDKELKLRFGELEAVLAHLNGIPSHQRTAFQARLKNFHRLGFPAGIGQGRGKAVIYTAREVLLMAVAVELTQLGLTPERVIEVITDDELPVWQCTAMAARSLKERPEVFNPGPGDTGNPPNQKVWGFSARWADSDFTDPLSMFLYCDPAALAPWDEEDADRASATFFYGGVGIIRENISRWTTGPTRRLALINVTKLLFDIAAHLSAEDGLKLVEQFEAAADAWLTRGDFELDEWLANVAKHLMLTVAAGPTDMRDVKFPKPEWITLDKLLADLPEGNVFRHITIFPEQYPEKGEFRDYKSPDMIVRLPGQRQLMVDAKVLPTTDIPQEAILSRIKELEEQPYRTMFTDRTEYIVLYVPSDDFFAQAMAIERNLFHWALEKKVVIATPSILLRLLAEAAIAWDKYREEFPDLGIEEYAGLQDETWSSGADVENSLLPLRIGHGDNQKA